MTTQISGDTGVSAVQDGVVQQSDLAANVVGKGPAFDATITAPQTFATTADTKVVFGSVVLDTNNNFTSSRFTPTVPGDYLVSAHAVMRSAATPGITLSLFLQKNGFNVKRNATSIAGTSYNNALALSAVVRMNGTTDYLEVWAGSTSALTTTVGPSGDSGSVNFSGALVRAA